MADKIVVEIDLDKGDVTGATAELEKAGAKAGQKAADSFAKNFNENMGKDIERLGKFALGATAAIAGLAAGLIGIKAIDAAKEQEDAVNALNSALLMSRNASVDASAGIQAFASEMQNSTRFADDAILRNAALIQSLGDLDANGLKRATAAAADLATVMRIDLDSASKMIAKAATGNTAVFNKLGIEVQKGATDAETFANALTQLEGKFGGAAQRDVNTFSGALDQMNNAFGDIFDEIGLIIIKNPAVIASIKMLGSTFANAASNVAEFGKTFDVFKFATENLVQFNSAVIDHVVAPLEFVVNMAELVGNSFNTFIAAAVAGFARMAADVSKVLNLVGIKTEFDETIRAFAETTDAVAKENIAATKQSLADVFNFEISDKLSEKNEQLKTFFEQTMLQAQEQAAIRNELAVSQVAQAEIHAMTIRDVYAGVWEGITSGTETATNSIEEANAKIAEFAQNSGKQLQQGFGRAAGSAFAAFGAAVQQGNASLAAFTNALFKSLAQSAVALGTNFILEGTAYLFSANPTLQALGPSLIASGAALATFGGVLGASVGGGSSAASGAGGGSAQAGGNTFARDTEEVASPELVQAEERVNLSLNVEGSIVRESELEGYVANLLENGGKKNATIIPSLRTA
jgi:hypothetical protein